MAVHLLALTTNGGLPIFTRRKGDCENLPFSTVASLNGFHIFFKSLGIKLQSVQAENDWSYIWQDFNNAITVIVCGRGLGEYLLQQLIELTFAAICLFVSRDEISFLDRIKKESKNFLPVVDSALESSLSLMPGLTDCVLANENSLLLQKLQDFSNHQSIASLFCSLIIDQRLCVATEGWWHLDVIDRQVLFFLLNSSNTLQNDIPIYLPNKSPNVAYRFVTIPLAPNAVLCVICGSGPAYNDLNKTAQSIFRNDALGLIQNVTRNCIARSLPDQLDIDLNVMAIILANFDVKKCVFSRDIQQSVGTLRSGSVQRLDMLKKFFYHFLETEKLFEVNSNNTMQSGIVDQYWCSDYHKCYALSDDNKNVIFVLFVASVPTHTMRFITQKILNSIIQEKSFCW